MLGKRVRRKIGRCTKQSCDGDVFQEFLANNSREQRVVCAKCQNKYTSKEGSNLYVYLQEHLEQGLRRQSARKEPNDIQFGERDLSRIESFRQKLLKNTEPIRTTCPFCGENNISVYYEPLDRFHGIIEKSYTGKRTFYKCQTCLSVWENEWELGEDVEDIRKSRSS